MRYRQMLSVTVGAILGRHEVVFSRTAQQSRTSFRQYRQWLRGHRDSLSFWFRKDSVEFPSGGTVLFTSARHGLDGVMPKRVIYDELDE